MLTHSATLYFSAVFIWGSTFYAIKFQLGEVPAELSVSYRFALAALILFLWCLLRGLPMRFTVAQHRWMLLQGMMLFGLNYLLVYWATVNLTSGLIAVIFSTIVLMNIVNGALLFGRRVAPSMVAGALFGLAGIGLVFWPELNKLEGSAAPLQGLLLCLAGTYLASLGNMASARNQANSIPVVQGNAYSMGYGALLLLLAALLQGKPLLFDFGPGYTLSLLYLSLFGSVVAFGSYLTLLGRIGPERAAYSMVLFPLVALGISTLFEGYQWSISALCGVLLVLIGNLLIIISRDHLRRLLKLIS